MPNYRRTNSPGATIFFTVVTYRCRPLLTLTESREMLRRVIIEVRRQHPFDIDAWVLLPEHIHCIWTLPPGDRDFSKRWGLIKAGFSKQAHPLFHRSEWITQSKVKHRESTIWQRRFWEHQVRDCRGRPEGGLNLPA
jgi:putative transposase